MEGALGMDFSAVRVHEGEQATAIGALAYTQGTNIHFAPGHYQPSTRSGQELLGHELTHVVQQSQGRVRATGQMKGVKVNDDAGLEAEADVMGSRAARGQAAQVQAMAHHSHRGIAQRQHIQSTIGEIDPISAKISDSRTAEVIQARFEVVSGTIEQRRTFADSVTQHGGSLGYTWPVLNDRRCHSTTDFVTVFRLPQLSVEDQGNGQFQVTLDSLGNNVGSWAIESLSPDQESGEISVTRGQLGRILATIKRRWQDLVVTDEEILELQNTNPEGNATIRVNADFTALAEDVLTHEMHHARDHQNVFTEFLGAWDSAMEQFRGRSAVINAKDAAAAVDNLYQAASIQQPAICHPVDLSDRIWTEMIARSNAFHMTPEGAIMPVKSVIWNRDAASIEFEFTAVQLVEEVPQSEELPPTEGIPQDEESTEAQGGSGGIGWGTILLGALGVGGATAYLLFRKK
ncbi:MAG: DUF4157 domain-containing protein [Proteobacteria bacterium]|nr:DUF4157 domain-containing protein [Pseudomonadota bacterium]